MKCVSKLAKDMLYQCCVADMRKTLLVAQLPASVFSCSFPFVPLARCDSIVPPVVCVCMDYDLSLMKVDGHEVIHNQGHEITFYTGVSRL